MNEKETRGVLQIFTANARPGLKPKGETNGSPLVLHPSKGVDTVNTVVSHFKITGQKRFSS